MKYLFGWAMVVALVAADTGLAIDSCPFACGDLNGDGTIDISDFGLFVSCMDQAPDSSQECFCSDLDGSTSTDLADFAFFTLIFEAVSDEGPPGCSGAIGTTANLTAYRPQHRGGYAPFARSAVSDADEESATLGPGIRINNPGDVYPFGEDDLIEVALLVGSPGAQLALRRTDSALAVWTTRHKVAGSEIVFVNN